MDEVTKDKKKYFFMRNLVRGFISRTFCYGAEVAEPDCGPMLVVSNHNTDMDPVLLGMSFKDHMYFVASEHVFRFGILSKILIWLFHPIARKKGTTDAMAALQIIRTLRKGSNVCLFAEGNRSFNGVTGPCFPATGKLARSAKAALVTFRIRGGYLTTPRWALKRRRGAMSGEIVHVYTNDQLRQMTDEQIEEAISRDLYEDAFETQRNAMIPFRGKRLAEGLENALYICPVCGAVGSLKGEGNVFRCTCGFETEYDEYGFFKGDNIPFTDVRRWDEWQDKRMEEKVAEALARPDEILFSDEGQKLVLIGENHHMEEIGRGTLSVSGNTLTLGNISIFLDDMTDMAIVGRNNIVFSCNGNSYEIRAGRKNPCCGRKYATFFALRRKALNSQTTAKED